MHCLACLSAKHHFICCLEQPDLEKQRGQWAVALNDLRTSTCSSIKVPLVCPPPFVVLGLQNEHANWAWSFQRPWPFRVHQGQLPPSTLVSARVLIQKDSHGISGGPPPRSPSAELQLVWRDLGSGASQPREGPWNQEAGSPGEFRSPGL